MSIVLRHQFEASERAADELELEASHRSAMLCRNVEDHIENLTDLFTKLNHAVERWQLADGGDVSHDRIEQARELESFYRRLERLFARTPVLIASVKSIGFKISGEREFSDAWRELRGIICFSADDIAAGREQVRKGEVRPLAEVMNELWDRPLD